VTKAGSYIRLGALLGVLDAILYLLAFPPPH
jgi:hypothetical protein